MWCRRECPAAGSLPCPPLPVINSRDVASWVGGARLAHCRTRCPPPPRPAVLTAPQQCAPRATVPMPRSKPVITNLGEFCQIDRQRPIANFTSSPRELVFPNPHLLCFLQETLCPSTLGTLPCLQAPPGPAHQSLSALDWRWVWPLRERRSVCLCCGLFVIPTWCVRHSDAHHDKSQPHAHHLLHSHMIDLTQTHVHVHTNVTHEIAHAVTSHTHTEWQSVAANQRA